MTDPNWRILRRNISTDVAIDVMNTANDFAAHFRKSPLGEANRADVESYIKEFVRNPTRASAYIERARAKGVMHLRRARCEIDWSGLLFGEIVNLIAFPLLYFSPYTISLTMQARAVMLRRVQILRGNILYTVMQIWLVAILLFHLGSTEFPIAPM